MHTGRVPCGWEQTGVGKVDGENTRNISNCRQTTRSWEIAWNRFSFHIPRENQSSWYLDFSQLLGQWRVNYICFSFLFRGSYSSSPKKKKRKENATLGYEPSLSEGKEKCSSSKKKIKKSFICFSICASNPLWFPQKYRKQSSILMALAINSLFLQKTVCIAQCFDVQLEKLNTSWKTSYSCRYI